MPIAPEIISMQPKARRRMACGNTVVNPVPMKQPMMPDGMRNRAHSHKSGVRNKWTIRAAPEERIKKTRLIPCAVNCGALVANVSQTTRSPALPTPSPDSTATAKVTKTVLHILNHQHDARNKHHYGKNTGKKPRADATEQKCAQRTSQKGGEEQNPYGRYGKMAVLQILPRGNN